ncbi:MAG: CHAT domain-containing protein [Candidatus Cyclobacteriaceae bacterium M3_2C_046]
MNLKKWLIPRLTLAGLILSVMAMGQSAPRNLLQKGDSLTNQGKYGLALTYYQQAAQAFKQQNELTHYFHCRNKAGFIQLVQVDYKPAFTYFQQQLAALDQQPSLPDTLQAEAHIYAGLAAFYLNQYQTSIKHYQQALELLQTMPHPPPLLLAYCYEGMGIYNDLFARDYGQSADWFHQVIQVLEDQPVTTNKQSLKLSLLWRAHFYLSNAFRNINELEKARTYLDQAISLLNQSNWLREKYLSYTYQSLSSLNRYQGNYQKAVFYGQKASVNKHETFKGNVGLYYIYLDQFDSAFSLLHQAFVHYHKQKNPYKVAIIQEYRGFAHWRQQNYDSAFYYYRAFLNLSRSLYGSTNLQVARGYNYLGECYRVRQQFDSARHYYTQAFAALFARHPSPVESWGPIWNRFKPQYQLEFFSYILFYNLGKMYYQQYDLLGDLKSLENSLQHYLRADSLLEFTRYSYWGEDTQLFLADSSQTLYEQTLKSVYAWQLAEPEQSRVELMLNLMEKNKARLLMEEAVWPDQAQDSLKQKAYQLKFRLNQLKFKLQQLQNQQDPCQKELSSLYSQVYDCYQQLEKLEKRQLSPFKAFKVQPLTINQLQTYCQDHQTQLLEYYWGNQDLYILQVNPQDYQVDQIGLSQKLTNNIDLLKQQLQNQGQSNRQDYQQYILAARTIFDQLVQPYLDPQWPQLVVIAEGPLNQLPFEALLTQSVSNSTIDYKTLPYLVRDYSLQYAYSSRYLLQWSRHSTTLQSLIGFGYSGSSDSPKQAGLSDLKGSSRELSAIRREFGRGRYYQGQDANEGVFKQEAGHYDIIHLAVHAQADPEHNLSSHLIFRQDTTDLAEDGRLYYYELYNLPLRSGLVVLSACETGQGKYQQGEGVYSMARAFALQGTPAQLMTLWSIDDQATVQLMQGFYKNFGKGNTIHQSLRQAQLDYLARADEYQAHPAHWAAFVAMGYTELTGNRPEQMFWWGLMVGIGLAGVAGFWGWRK